MRPPDGTDNCNLRAPENVLKFHFAAEGSALCPPFWSEAERKKDAFEEKGVQKEKITE
jgi:hypothetical protein